MSRRDTMLKRGLFLLAVLGAAVVALWFFWLRHCGTGKGRGEGVPAAAASIDGGTRAGPLSDGSPRCRVRVDARGVYLDGKRASHEETIAACKRAGSAVLTVTGDASYGTVRRIKDGLRRANVAVTTH